MSRSFFILLSVTAILSFLFCTELSYAQQSQARFENLNVRDGLSHSTSMDILQDSYGYLWVGTPTGLNKYDGYRFTRYMHDKEDSTTLANDYIRALLEDSEKNLLVGTKSGLHLFERNSENFQRIDLTTLLHLEAGDRGQKTNDVLSIVEAAPKQYWLGTSSGLVFVDIASSKAHRVDYGGADTTKVEQLLVDNHGMLWIGDSNGYVVRREKEYHFEKKATDSEIVLEVEVPIRALHEDKNGTVWIGTEEKGLFQFDTNSNYLQPDSQVVPVSLNLPSDFITTINTDDRGQLWIGFWNDGFALVYDQDKIKHFVASAGDQYSLLSNQVWDIYTDRTGVTWIGTWEGLSRLSPHFDAIEFIGYSDGENDLIEPRVVAFEEETPGKYWLGTFGGLFSYDATQNTFKHFLAGSNQNALCGNEIFDLNIDEEQNLWIATLHSGLCKLDLKDKNKGRFEYQFLSYDLDHPSEEAINHNGLHSVLASIDGKIWIGTRYSGVNILDPKSEKFVHYDESEGFGNLPTDYIWPIIEDHDHSIWLGTMEAGLLRYNEENNSFDGFSLGHESPNSNLVYDLYQDSRHFLWAATDDGVKVISLDSMHIDTYRMEDGLPHNSVRGVVEDNYGDMWISTNGGLAQFSIKDSTFKNYYLEDGLQGDRFYARSVMKASDGRLFFGGANGFNIIDPSKLRTDPLTTQVVLSEIRVNNNIYEKEGEPPPYLMDRLTLEHDENRFSLSFSSLDYTNVSKVKYKWRLNKLSKRWNPFKSAPVDTSWTDNDTSNEVTFPLQDFGEYNFEVVATNSDGEWSEAGALELPITILTPWYATSWFRGLILLAIIGAIIGGLLVRTNYLLGLQRNQAEFQLEAERMQSDYQLGIERLRLKIAQGLHDDVGASLATIAMQLSMMKSRLQISEKEKERIRKLGAIVRETGQVVRETGWVINAKHDSLFNLVNQMQEQALLMLDGQRGYTFNQSPTPMPDQLLEMDFKQNVYFLFKEALNNANKYSQASHVDINVTLAQNVLTVRVADNGIGFDMANIKEGSGLGNMKDRAAEIGATYDMKSTPGKGTTITLTATLIEPNPPDATEMAIA